MYHCYNIQVYMYPVKQKLPFLLFLVNKCRNRAESLSQRVFSVFTSHVIKIKIVTIQ